MTCPGRNLTQTGSSSDQPSLQAVNLPFCSDKRPEPQKILDAFESALQSLTQSSMSVEDTARNLVDEIKTILPSTANENKQAFLVDLDLLLIRIAQQMPSRHVGQDLLVAIVHLLNVSAEASWHEEFLRALGMGMRDGWIGSTLEEGQDEGDVLTPDEWLNLNSFNARLLGSGVTKWYNFSIWQLREGLEDELGLDADDNDCKIAVASEWLIQAGPKLLGAGMHKQDLSESEKRSYSGGKLWTGEPGLNTDRWRYWKRRLGEVKETVRSQVAQDYLDQAERMMMTAEGDLDL